MKGRSAAGSRH